MSFSTRQFRNALGSFTTGVTIVTTTDNNGTPFGLTVNSFASVSLDPPLILWSIGKDSNSFDVFNISSHFAIHVLYSDQQQLSALFASKNEHKFNGMNWSRGNNGSPILDEYISCFECTTEFRYPGGDHVILVGRVSHFDIKNDNNPLLYHKGEYK